MKRFISLFIVAYYSLLLLAPGLLHWGHEAAHALNWAFHQHEIHSGHHRVEDHLQWLHDLEDQEHEDQKSPENLGFLFLLWVFYARNTDFSLGIDLMKSKVPVFWVNHWDDISGAQLVPPPQFSSIIL